jgi:hypothetical protein
MRWRSVGTIALFLGFISLLAFCLYSWLSADTGMKIVRLDDEAIRLAATLFFSKMTAIGQLTLGLLGATWALLIVKEARISVSERPVVACFFLTNLSFIASLFFYSAGYDFVVSRIYYHRVFDIHSDLVIQTKLAQELLFVYGCLSLIATILLGSRRTEVPAPP